MRKLCLLVSGLMVVTGCHCAPPTPTPVTFRLKNSTRDAVFVDNSDGRFGMQVQRKVGGAWTSFVERPACACQTCDSVCSCSCDAGAPDPRVSRVPGGTTAERQWSGVVQISNVVSCGGALIGGATSCLRAENASADEDLQLRLCYSLSVPGFQDLDGGPAPGVLPEKGVLCLGQRFRPSDGVVEISPQRGADCATHEQCVASGGKDSLCFSGSCTTSCPANDFPELGGAWQVTVTEPDDQGFFTFTTVGGRKTWTGVGTVSSVLYQNGTMSLRLTRTGPSGEALNGAIYVTLPPAHQLPISPGTAVQVYVVDASSTDNPQNRAVTLREPDGGLLLAADSAQQGRVLGDGETAPFAVASMPGIEGCLYDECGKRLYHAMRFSSGAAAVDLSPGKSAQQSAAGANFNLVNASDFDYGTTWCKLSRAMPYIVLRDPR